MAACRFWTQVVKACSDRFAKKEKESVLELTHIINDLLTKISGLAGLAQWQRFRFRCEGSRVQVPHSVLIYPFCFMVVIDIGLFHATMHCSL